MPAGRRRDISSFNLAFLDIMFCGFGAVVLLVLIVQANTIKSRKEQFEDLRDEVDRAALTSTAENQHLQQLKAQLDSLNTARKEAERALEGVNSRIARVGRSQARQREQAIAARQGYEQKKTELRRLQAELDQLKTREPIEEQGRNVRRFVGEGNRQYLTGLHLGGRRIALLVDVSASMLDETVVNILRRRNMSAETRRNARKWQQAKKTVEWLVANMPVEARIQIITFNNKTAQLGKDTWVSVQDTSQVDAMLEQLRQVIPKEGTNLANAFTSLAALNPRPDNLILLTDGLPTLGSRSAATGSVTAKKRVSLFHKARKKIPASIPVNTVLFPMEGDPLAASLFWQLAIETKGSFFTPTRDWP